MKPASPIAALQELRTLVATYLEGSDDAPRAAELLDALDAHALAAAPAAEPLAIPDENAPQRSAKC